MPFPGNAPLQFVTPLEDYKIPPAFTPSAMDSTLDDGDVKKPRWVYKNIILKKLYFNI